MKKLFTLVSAISFLTLGLVGCSKTDTQTPCPSNPLTSQSLCGTWLNITTTNNPTHSMTNTTETWTIKRTDKNYVEIKLVYNGSLTTDVTIPFSIGTDTTFIRYDVEAGAGSQNVIFKMSNSGDTLILTSNNIIPPVQKFIQQ